MKGLSISTLAGIVLFLATTSFAMNLKNVPRENLRRTCEQRMLVFDKDLQSILRTSSYERKYRKKVRATRDDMGLKKDWISEELSAIKAELQTTNSMAITNCLVRTTDMLLKLNAVALQGHKNLDKFSNGWREAFPNQVRRLGNQ